MYQGSFSQKYCNNIRSKLLFRRCLCAVEFIFLLQVLKVWEEKSGD